MSTSNTAYRITLTLYDPHLASVNTLNISTLLVGRGQSKFIQSL